MALRKTGDNFGPTNMSNAGDVKRGVDPAMGDAAVNYFAPYDNTLPFLSLGGWIAQGSIVHLNDSGYFVPGVPATAGTTDTNFKMPMMIAYQSSNEPSSKTNQQWDSATALPPNMPWLGTPKEGVLTAFPLCNGYEYATTEFICDEQGITTSTYKPNTPLTAVPMTYSGTGYDATAAQTDGKYAGMLKPATIYKDNIVGIVSTGVGPYRNKRPQLQFWGFPVPSLPASH